MKDEQAIDVGKLWLRDDTTYPLKLGFNLVGRISGIYKNDISVDTDDVYLGRQHFIVEVVINKSGLCDYIVSDNKSKNGTCIVFATDNLRKILKPSDKVYLKNGDMIFAGKTMFKLRASAKHFINENTGNTSDRTQIRR
jgi:pSer/pThr/pTyr-binding forkhead associated (FHA) protein